MNIKNLMLYILFFSIMNLQSAESESALIALAKKESLITFHQETAEMQTIQKAIDASLKEKNSKESSDASKNLKINIIRLPVLKQQGLDCAYHSVKNGKAIFNWLTGKLTEAECDNQLKTFPQLEQWRKDISANFKIKTNLDDLQIDALAKTFSNLDTNNYTIISNILEIDKMPKLDNLQNILKKIKNSSKITHIFLLGNMKHLSNQLKGTDGHWIAIVVHKNNNELNYYSTDSLSGKTIDALLPKLRELIES